MKAKNRERILVAVVASIFRLLPKFLIKSFYGMMRNFPTKLGKLFRIACFKRLCASCGVRIDVEEGVSVKNWGRLEIGNYVSLNENAMIDASFGVKIGNYARIAYYSKIVSSQHNYKDHNKLIMLQGLSGGPIIIGEDVWICTGVVITPNIKIGKGSVIGANSVVTRDVPPYTVFAGVPAKLIKKR